MSDCDYHPGKKCDLINGGAVAEELGFTTDPTDLSARKKVKRWADEGRLPRRSLGQGKSPKYLYCRYAIRAIAAEMERGIPPQSLFEEVGAWMAGWEAEALAARVKAREIARGTMAVLGRYAAEALAGDGPSAETSAAMDRVLAQLVKETRTERGTTNG